MFCSGFALLCTMEMAPEASASVLPRDGKAARLREQHVASVRNPKKVLLVFWG